MHSIVQMAGKLRAAPGKFGLCTGNGWYVTKHSAGIYSTTPKLGAWKREDPKAYQKELDAMAHPEVTEKPNGRASVETYTVVVDRRGKRFGIVIGRLEDGKRFLSHTRTTTRHWTGYARGNSRPARNGHGGRCHEPVQIYVGQSLFRH